MTQKNILIAVVAILVIGGAGWYWYSSSGSSAPTQTTSDSQNTQGQTTHKTTSLKALATQGGNYTCTISTLADNGMTNGTVYSTSGKTRLDFVAQGTGGTNVTIHTIRANGFSYTWVDGQSVGTKSAITASGTVVPQPSGGVATINDDVQVSSDCHPWSPVASQFVPPTGITFVAK